MAGNLAAVVSGFGPLRSAGNALAARGHGRIAQGGADVATAVGTGAVADTIRDGNPLGMNTHVAITNVAPVAAASRYFMPNLPANLATRAVLGTATGAITGWPAMTIGGDYTKPIINAAIGGLMAASGRPSPRMAPYQASNRMENSAMIASASGVPMLASYLSSAEPDYIQPTTPAVLDWQITKDAPHQKYPPPLPSLADILKDGGQ